MHQSFTIHGYKISDDPDLLDETSKIPSGIDGLYGKITASG